MDKRKEFSLPPAEYEPRAAEFPSPPPEYDARTAPAPGAERPSGRRRLRALLFAGTAVVTGWVLLGSALPPDSRPTAPPPAAVTAVPALIAESTPAPVAEPTAAPTVEPTPTATPEPEKPEASAIFLSFSDTLEGTVTFRGQENILKAYAQLWDHQIGMSLGGYDIPHEAIAEGIYHLPTIDVGELYWANEQAYANANDAFPDPELQIIYLIRNEDGEEEERIETVQNRYELGWTARYWDADADPEWGYPGCLAFSTYESTQPVELMYSQEDPENRGAISLWITINGREVPAELIRLEPEEESYGDTTYYYGNLIVPLPDWAGEHGTARFTIRQSLRGYDEIWTAEREVEY